MKSNLIKDNATREAVRDLEIAKDNLSSIPQLPSTATLTEVIAVINKINNSVKRR